MCKKNCAFQENIQIFLSCHLTATRAPKVIGRFVFLFPIFHFFLPLILYLIHPWSSDAFASAIKGCFTDLKEEEKEGKKNFVAVIAGRCCI